MSKAYTLGTKYIKSSNYCTACVLSHAQYKCFVKPPTKLRTPLSLQYWNCCLADRTV